MPLPDRAITFAPASRAGMRDLDQAGGLAGIGDRHRDVARSHHRGGDELLVVVEMHDTRHPEQREFLLRVGGDDPGRAEAEELDPSRRHQHLDRLADGRMVDLRRAWSRLFMV